MFLRYLEIVLSCYAEHVMDDRTKAIIEELRAKVERLKERIESLEQENQRLREELEKAQQQMARRQLPFAEKKEKRFLRMNIKLWGENQATRALIVRNPTT